MDLLELVKVKLLAKKFFNLELPVRLPELKKAYRAACVRLHPDKGGDAKGFVEMSAVYENILELASKTTGVIEDDGDVSYMTEVEGTPIHELGKGLGSTKNGKDCDYCSRKGYKINYGQCWDICDTCLGSGIGLEFILCKSCRGRGRFDLIDGRVVDCKQCGGTGEIGGSPRRGTWCRKCTGTGRMCVEDSDKIFYTKCVKCGGAGEIEIFNPVLPKGRLY